MAVCLLTLTLYPAAPVASAPVSAHWLLDRLKCIHRHEGSWTDDNPPYWGGLQMDADFERTYGREFVQAFGHANHWPPAVQLAVGMRAVLSGRGFGPWPQTRKLCHV